MKTRTEMAVAFAMVCGCCPAPSTPPPLTASPVPPQATAAAQPRSLPSLQQLLDGGRAESGAPALAAVVVSSDKTLEIGVSGVRRNDQPDKVELQDRFHIGSNVKSMTAVLAAMLVHDGRIEWATRYFDLFPGVSSKAKPAYADITLASLLSHRARLQPLMAREDLKKAPKIAGDLVQQRRGFAEWALGLDPVELDSQKGFVYSNAGYVVAASMLEKVAGKGWEELIQTRLLAPLQINGTQGWPALAAGQPFGHMEEKGKLVPHEPREGYQPFDFARPAGDMSMSIAHYGRYLQLFLKGLRGRKPLLPSAAIEHLLYANKGTSAYNLGWVTISKGPLTLSLHDGTAGTFYCKAVLIKERDIGIGVFANAASKKVAKATSKLAKALISRHGAQQAQPSPAQPSPAQPSPAQPSPANR